MASPSDNPVRTNPARLAALRRLGLLDGPASEQFDRLTRLAVRMLEVPAAFVSLVDEERDFYLSHCGFGEPLASVRELRGETFCHHVLRTDAPLVIPDTRADPVYRQVPTVESLGVAAYAGVPIRLPDGTVLGSFCVIDQQPRHWTEREIEFLREMGASVAAEIALRAEVEERRRTGILRKAERGILEQISRGEPVKGVLDSVIRLMEQELEDVQCCVLLLRRESGTLHVGAAPHLPAGFTDAIEGTAAVEGMGACGTAVHRNQPVVIRDIWADPLEAVFRSVAEAHGIRAAWSHPIRASDGSVLGTFALYGSRVREPDDYERALVERAAHLAGVAIERHRSGEELRMRDRALASIAEGVVITDARQPDNPIVHANAAFERITGYSEADAIGRNGRYLQGPDTDPELAARLEDVFRSGQSFRGEILNYRKDGTPFWNLLSVTPVHDESGRLSNFVVVQQDVTEQKRARDELAAAEAHYRRLIETSPMGIYSLDRQGRCMEVNSALEEILGQPGEALIGRHFADVLVPEDRMKAGRSFAQRMSGHPVTSALEVHIVRPGGERRLVQMYAAVIRENGQITGTHGLVRDITEEREREAQMHLLAAAMENLNEGVTITTLDRRILYANPAYARNLGIEPGTEREYTIDDFLPDDAAREQLREGMTSVQKEGTWSGRVWRRRRDTGEVFPLNLLAGVVEGVGGERLFVTVTNDARREMEREQRLNESEAHYQRLVATSPYGIFVLDTEGRLREINAAGAAIHGRTAQELLGKPLRDLIHPDDLEVITLAVSRAVQRNQPGAETEYRVVRPTGEVRHVVAVSAPIHSGGRTVGLHGIARDVTMQRQLEADLRQAQKMEAIGRLAGGVAHDFNNLLTAITGYAQLIRLGDNLTPDQVVFLDEVLRAAQRSADLTRQLLAFSRRQILQPTEVDLNQVVADTARLLHRLIGEDIEVHTWSEPRLHPVFVDAGQMNQVLMNLAVNARDAMPAGGQLTIRTSNLHLAQARSFGGFRIRPGDYVVLSVADTGTGMDEETRARIFEPFFTTKAAGQGTGLGLSTVYGIVKQSGGYIAVESGPGRGSVFSVYLPAVEADSLAAHPEPEADRIERGTETILLVEDEQGVRDLAQLVLKRSGYRLLVAEDGPTALQMARDSKIDLLLTDVVMPQMSGSALAAQIQAAHPGVRVLYMSGYTSDSIVRAGVLEEGTHLLHKPFTIPELTRKVREVLDARHGPEGSGIPG